MRGNTGVRECIPLHLTSESGFATMRLQLRRQCLRDQNVTKSDHSVRKVTRREEQHLACGQLGPDACNSVEREADEAV